MTSSFDILTGRMTPKSESEVSQLIASVVGPLEYYNTRARREEIGKYSAAQIASMAGEDADAVIVARIGAQVVGFCLSKYDDGLIWLSWFGVREQFRHRGIGFNLLRALDATVPRRNAHKVWCDTRTSNLMSQSVLHKAGFKQIALLTNHWYGQDYFLWEKTLSSASP